MALNAAQEQQARQWLRSAGVSDDCPACRMSNASWIFSDILIALTPDPGAAQLIPSPGAMVARICQNCTYHMIFAAKPMGLIQ